MTIDEAKIKIEELACYARTKGWDDEYTEAVNMTIKALEQEPCENVPDLYECPCGYGWDKNKVVRHHFCPNCGRAVDGSIKTEQEPCDDCIRRSDIGLTDFEIVMCNGDYKEALKMLLDKIEKVPSVTPQPKIGSSSEKPNKWNPITSRPMTEEEKEHYKIHLDYWDECRIFNCKLPDDGQEVLISVYGGVEVDTFVQDANDGCYFEGRDIDDVDAWMPLPPPYKSEIPTGQIVANGELYPGEFDDPLAEEGSDKE